MRGLGVAYRMRAMPSTSDILQIVLVVAAMVCLGFVVRGRRRSHARFLQEFADTEICEHLRPALVLLESRGHRVARVGQKNPELPLEIHIAPAFWPKAVYEELKLAAPVYVSERNVLYCRDDECELHPAGPQSS